MDSARQLKQRRMGTKFAPSDWSEYYAKKYTVETNAGNGTDKNKFCTYEVGSAEGTVILMLHGGGHSALSFAVVASEMNDRTGDCRFVSFDIRNHGETVTAEEKALSKEVLCQDVVDFVKELYGEDPPKIVLVGHSMGGAVAVHLAADNLLPSLSALVVIDVVEGSAVAALPDMISFLRSRPQKFNTMEDAISWNVRSGQIKSANSAKVSVPKQVKSVEIRPGERSYTWAVDLESTEAHWYGWFSNLSEKFLSAKVPKLLVLAGINTLDVPLTVAQMQGKFQMQVIEGVGHNVHEDAPTKVADVLVNFLARHKLVKKEGKPTLQFMPAC